MTIKKQDEGWTMEKKLTISGLCSIAMLSGSVLAVYVGTAQRINTLEIAVTYQKGVNDQLKESQREMKSEQNAVVTEVKASMTRLEGKVDSLILQRNK